MTGTRHGFGHLEQMSDFSRCGCEDCLSTRSLRASSAAAARKPLIGCEASPKP